MDSVRNTVFEFYIGERRYAPFSVEGEEAISELYRFDIDFAVPAEEDAVLSTDLDALLLSSAHLIIRVDDTVRMFHGIVFALEQGDQVYAPNLDTAEVFFRYRAVLMPRLALTTLNRRNRVFGGGAKTDLKQILESELTARTLPEDDSVTGLSLLPTDFELRSWLRQPGADDFPQRDAVVQYQETDYAFISRLCERDGFFFFFENGEGAEKLIISDQNAAFGELPAPLLYQPPSGMAVTDANNVFALTRRRQAVGKKVSLRDYNEESPHVVLATDKEIEAGQWGLISEYGDEFSTPSEGRAVARIRAEAQATGADLYQGRSTAPLLRAGCIARIAGHFRRSSEQGYVITRVRHSGRCAAQGAPLDTDGRPITTDYVNTFEAIPHSQPYRPLRKTPRPKIGGLVTAIIDSDSDGKRADIDDQGRYKVVFPFDYRFDPDGTERAEASRYIRLATPYAGSKQGMHFPLRKGTEVILAFYDGDPDRPVIVGALANAKDTNVVTKENQTSNRIVTASGVILEITDGTGGE